METTERVAELLGGEALLGRPVRTWADVDRLVQEGLPKRSLQLVAQRVVAPGTSMSTFVYSLVPAATFKRRTRLSPEESERTVRVARVLSIVDALTENEDESRAFMNRQHALLDGETPLALARTEIGARRVEQLLYNIMHGLPL